MNETKVGILFQGNGSQSPPITIAAMNNGGGLFATNNHTNQLVPGSKVKSINGINVIRIFFGTCGITGVNGSC
jgi:hypothetical protein